MIKQEFIIVGCLFVALGIAACVVGYNKSQPTDVDKVMGTAVSIFESVSGEKLPVENNSEKSEGYMFFGAGVVLFLIGVGFIIKSRTPSNKNNNEDGSKL